MVRIGVRVPLRELKRLLVEIPENFSLDVLLEPKDYSLESIPHTLEQLDEIAEMGTEVVSLSIENWRRHDPSICENVIFLAESMDVEYIVFKLRDPVEAPPPLLDFLVGSSVKLSLVPPRTADIIDFKKFLSRLEYRQFVTIAYDIFERYTGQTKDLVEEISNISGLLSIVYLAGMDKARRRICLSSKGIIDVWEVISNLVALREDVLLVLNYGIDRASLMRDYNMIKQIYTSIVEKL